MGTSQFTLQEGFVGFADADFSFVSLNIGSKYTASIAAPDYDWGVAANNPYWASGDPFPGKTDYAGGEMIVSGVLQPLQDLTFRVIIIPEPSIGALFVGLPWAVVCFRVREMAAGFYVSPCLRASNLKRSSTDVH